MLDISTACAGGGGGGGGVVEVLILKNLLDNFH
jgi:hypothetical protein